MQSKFLAMTFAASLLLFASSCKKSDDSSGGGSLSASSLNAGKSAITFNTSSSGFGNFSSINAVNSSAVFTTSGAISQITVIAAETGTSGVKTAQLTINLPAGSSTSSGNISGDFSTPTGTTVVPVLLIGSAGISGSESYTSSSGTLTITKLSTTEVEGTFSGSFVNNSTHTSTNVTNGQFTGKF
ncbi:MAG: hypothetical protein JST27_05195 [Bacteroidetes bacterium]|nr:hypothetical protein [Bacteroidota bacterium]